MPDSIDAGDPGRRDEDGPARRTGEDPFPGHELAKGDDRVPVRDEELAGEQGRVEDLRDEPLVERAQALDILPGQRLGGEHPDRRLGPPEEAGHAHQGPARAQPGHECVDLRAVGQDLGAGRLLVDTGVRRVAVLVGHDVARLGGHELLGQRDRPVRPERARRLDHLGAEQLDQLAPLGGDVVGHDQGHPIALPTTDHRQGDPGVARRRLEDDRVGAEPARSPRGPRSAPWRPDP